MKESATRSIGTPRPTHRAYMQRARAAFTLVELVVSILLMAALLTATWTMLNSFRDRFEKSQTRVERTQLIRAVHQVFENDLASCLVTRSRRPQSSQNSAGGLFAPLSRERLAATRNSQAGSGTQDTQESTVGAGGQARSLGDTSVASVDGAGSDAAATPALSIDAASDAAANQAAEMDGTDGTQNVSLGLQSETDRVAQNEWFAPDTRFYGTSTALVCDLVVPAEMADAPASPFGGLSGANAFDEVTRDSNASSTSFSGGAPMSPMASQRGTAGAPSDRIMSGGAGLGGMGLSETAEIPELTRRVVYLFTDPDTGMRAGRPAGLVRCELTNRQMASLRVTASDRMDLFALLQPVIGGPPRLGDLAGAGSGLEDGLVNRDALGNDPTSPSSGSLSTMPDALPIDAEADGSQMNGATAMPSPGPAMQADLLSEVVSFRLRYFDGESWHSSWDSRERRELPVAVEMRFRLSDPATLNAATNSTSDAEVNDPNAMSDLGAASTASDTASSEAARLEAMAGDSEMTDDPRQMSAQTRPVEDHRYVVLLSSPPALRPSSGNVSEEGEDEAPSGTSETVEENSSAVSDREVSR